MGKQQQATNPKQCGIQSQWSNGMRNILQTCRDSNDRTRVSNLFTNMGVEISKADFTSEFDKTDSDFLKWISTEDAKMAYTRSQLEAKKNNNVSLSERDTTTWIQAK